MKKNHILGLALATLVASLSACSNDSEDIISQGNEIKLTSKIIPSRVSALDCQSTQIVEGQKVGVTITGATSVHKNVQWTVGAEGTLTNGGNPVFFSEDDEAVITAYHPYDSYYTGTSHQFKVNTNQSTEEGYLASDLLWAKTTSTQTNEPVSLVFSHKLANVNVTLVPFIPGTDLSDITVYICGTKTSTYFNPTDGSLSDYTGASVGEIKAGVTTENAYTASAIVIPQTLAAGTQFIRIVQGDKVYSYNVGSQGKELLSGISHNYTLTVKDKGLELVSNNIENWGDDNVEGVIEEQKFSWFNPNQYITYVENEDSYYSGKDDDNSHDHTSSISFPIEKISKMELKYKMFEAPTEFGPIYLFCKNTAEDDNDQLTMTNNGIVFSDGVNSYVYTWSELQINSTDCMTFIVSFNEGYINMNGNNLDFKMPKDINFTPDYLFTKHYYDKDPDVTCEIGYGVPEKSKLYYAKVWDEDGNLVYLGGASKSLNPNTNQEEYCWRSYSNGKDSYHFANYAEKLIDNNTYQPYGGGID